MASFPVPAPDPAPDPAPHHAPHPASHRDAWPYLGPEQLLPSRSRHVCLTCQWFRHHAGADDVPLLSCQWHQALICHGDHLTQRCPSWLEPRQRSSGWCPEAA
ncbi:galactose oxidase [Aphanothece minutissima]|uniref:Galactose oxidase n=1 Tax=Aphanothece cf. minutissima CCALA 015 TaxID=2107695 RepID=A0ABX5F4P4_9CHRO|nr:galactose oxidase [Aphanothece minutissima]PSB36373.1 galactose oxidase [Aphanothece cf. minutissima CCALA 015]